MDYIENYRSALKNKFKNAEDKQAKTKCWKQAPLDIAWGKKVGLIKEMSYEDYLEANLPKSKPTVTDEMRSIIASSLEIPTWILAQYYGLHQSTIQLIRQQARESV